MIIELPPQLREVINKILSRVNNNHGYANGQYELQGIREEKSAQQQVFILQLALETEATRNRDSLKEIISCIDDVRNDEPQDNNWSCPTIAIQSGRNRLVLLIWSGGVVDHNGGICIGYQVARQALSSVSSGVPRIPMVLLFDQGWTDMDQTKGNQFSFPWAVLEYVGPDSLYLPLEQVDRFYFDVMMKVREKFGFDEPHPRWGRVAVDKSLQYAQI
jgi:hypothetical protein